MSNTSANLLEIPIESGLFAKVESPLRALLTNTVQLPFLFGATPFNQGGPILNSGNILTARYDAQGIYDGNTAQAGVQWDVSYVDYMTETGIPGVSPTAWIIWFSVYIYDQGSTFFITDTPPPGDNYNGITPQSYGLINGFAIFPTISNDYHDTLNPGIVTGVSKKGASCWVYAYVNCTVSKHTINATAAAAGDMLLNPAGPGGYMQSIVPPPAGPPSGFGDGHTAYEDEFYAACRCDADHFLVMWIGLTPAQLPQHPFSANQYQLLIVGDPNLGSTPITNDATNIDAGTDKITE